MVSKKILEMAAITYQFDVESLVFVSNSTNVVYRFMRDKQPFILRLSSKPIEYEDKIKAEIEWVYDLAQKGVKVSLPIRTADNKFTAVFWERVQCYIATAFHMAPGRFFDKHDSTLWGPVTFRRWGETMGKMHLHAKSYGIAEGAAKRADWNLWSIENPFLLQGDYYVLLEKLKSLESKIVALPKDVDSYGLIHNDFHPYNFYIDNGEITVFDFDDCIYGWFALDIAIAATHAVWWGSPADDRKSRRTFAELFMNEFLSGYCKYNQLDKFWIQLVPMFMDYRNICSYFWWLSGWNGDESILSEHQRSAIAYAIKLINNGEPFDGCDIEL